MTREKIPVARFLILKTQNVTYYTGKIACQRRSLIIEFISVISSNTGNIHGHNTPCEITHKRKFLGQVTLKVFLTVSLREKPLGVSIFHQKVRNGSSPLVKLMLNWTKTMRPLLLCLHSCRGLPQTLYKGGQKKRPWLSHVTQVSESRSAVYVGKQARRPPG